MFELNEGRYYVKFTFETCGKFVNLTLNNKIWF